MNVVPVPGDAGLQDKTGRRASGLLASVELMHMIRKCHLGATKDPASPAATRQYLLAF